MNMTEDCAVFYEFTFVSTNAANLYNMAATSPDWCCNNFIITTPQGQLRPLACTNGRIQDMNLANLNLQGSLPASFGNLSALRNLDLSTNQLSGMLAPPPISSPFLPALAFLNLANNMFSGDISALSNCRFVQQLHLLGNRFHGPLEPVRNMLQVETC